MALEALKAKGSELTDIQQQYLDILIDEYGGFVPFGEKKKIAERIGCTTAYLSNLDHGQCHAFIKEKRKRLRDAIPMADDLVQLSTLQWILEDTMDARMKDRSRPLSSKDPVDIIDMIRKVTQGPKQSINATQNVKTTFDFSNLDDEALSNAIKVLTSALREGDIPKELGDIVEGELVEPAES